jgi:Lrp/AsnC family transcriptional regulator of lysine biosynthesis
MDQKRKDKISLFCNVCPQCVISAPDVETVYEVTGEYDIVAVISGMNVTEVNECIEKIRRVKGIMKTNTMIVLRSS